MDKKQFIPQLSELVARHREMAARSRVSDLSDFPKVDRQALVTQAVAAVERIAGIRSSYGREIQRILKDIPLLHHHLSPIIGVVQALLADISNDYIQSVVELVHAEVFADFLDMAEHLLIAGYKDASAVIAGSALEAHLRALCEKAGIPLEVARPDGTMSPKKADSMNSELAAGGVYTKLDQKNVTAWLDLRNKAAHGKYGEYTHDQVNLLIAAVRDFITRNSA